MDNLPENYFNDHVEGAVHSREDQTHYKSIDGTEVSYMIDGGIVNPTGNCFHDGCTNQSRRAVCITITQLRDESGCGLPANGKIAKEIKRQLYHGENYCEAHSEELSEMIRASL